MAKIVIIGAGLTGLSAAYHLEKRGFTDYALFEKEDDVGGLCRSVKENGFVFDYTGHLLHTSDDYFKKFIDSLVGLASFNSINRRSFVYSNNTFTRYPYQINLYGLPPSVITECIEGYVKRPQQRQKIKSFPQWVDHVFGKGFAKHFFLPFQQKLFAYDLHDITASWTGRFVPKTSLHEMLIGALEDKKVTEVGYNSHFYYPKKDGIQFWIDKLAQHIKKPIYRNHEITQIDLQKKVVSFANGHCEPFTYIINTMPLNTCIRLLKERSATIFKHVVNKLKCNSVLNFNLGFARKNLTEKHWIYFPEKKFPFYRLGFPHNFSEHMAPPEHSSLYGELSFIDKEKRHVERMLTHALKQVKDLFNIAEEEIVCKKIISISHAYVIYNFWREKNLAKLLRMLSKENIYSTGRYGAWKYSSMQEAVLDGKKIAEQLTVLPAKTYVRSTLHQPHKERELSS